MKGEKKKAKQMYITTVITVTLHSHKPKITKQNNLIVPCFTK